MSQGITIKITRMKEVRERYPDEYGLRLFTGMQWVRPDALPWPPELAAYCTTMKAKPVTTTIAFLPPGVTPIALGHYRKSKLRAMRAQGVIR